MCNIYLYTCCFMLYGLTMLTTTWDAPISLAQLRPWMLSTQMWHNSHRSSEKWGWEEAEKTKGLQMMKAGVWARASWITAVLRVWSYDIIIIMTPPGSPDLPSSAIFRHYTHIQTHTPWDSRTWTVSWAAWVRWCTQPESSWPAPPGLHPIWSPPPGRPSQWCPSWYPGQRGVKFKGSLAVGWTAYVAVLLQFNLFKT